jgi:hypothetical protein
MYDGAVHEVTEWLPTVNGTDVVLRGPNSVCRMSVVELVSGTRVRLLIDSSGPESTVEMVPAAVVLSSLPKKRLEEVRERAAHVREVLTGYRSGNSEIAAAGEPSAEFDHSRPLCDRYAAKAAELGVDERTVRRWVKAYEENGEAGLVPARFALQNRIDPRWSEAALAIMREHTQESKPSEKAVIYQTSKRFEICFGHGVVPEPSQGLSVRPALSRSGQGGVGACALGISGAAAHMGVRGGHGARDVTAGEFSQKFLVLRDGGRCAVGIAIAQLGGDVQALKQVIASPIHLRRSA